jgi:hypothetical protein
MRLRGDQPVYRKTRTEDIEILLVEVRTSGPKDEHLNVRILGESCGDAETGSLRGHEHLN